jgi:hypothetical protein
MSNLGNALRQLRQEHKQAQHQVEKLQSAVSVLEDLVGRNGSEAPRNGARPRSSLSRAGRARIAAAQRARWAKVRKDGARKSTGAAMPKKRTISAAGRRRIVAATKARWARFRALKSKKTA